MKNAALALLLVAAPAAAQQQPQQPMQMPPSIGYKLSMQPIEACHRAMMALLQRAKNDPTIRAEQERAAQPDGDTPEQIVAYMRKTAPNSTAFMVQNGCAPDEYVKIGFATMEAITALDMIEHKQQTNTLTPIARDNASFIKANQARLQAIDEEADKAEAAAGLSTPQPGQAPQGAPSASQPPQAPLPWQQQQQPQRR